MSWAISIVSLITFEAAALAQTAAEGAAPAPAEPIPEGPAAAPGPAAPTRATFVSTSSEQWDVTVDQQPMCATPCSLQLFPYQFATLQTQEMRPVIVDVGRLPAGDFMVTGTPPNHGMYAGGIVATSFGGMGVATGITLVAIGAAKDRDGMFLAGLITGAAGGAALVGGIYLMFKALPSVSIGRATPYVSANQIGVAGTF